MGFGEGAKVSAGCCLDERVLGLRIWIVFSGALEAEGRPDGNVLNYERQRKNILVRICSPRGKCLILDGLDLRDLKMYKACNFTLSGNA